MYLAKFRLDGRIAFVTGGAQGIGLAIAEALAEAGAEVIIADLAPAALDAAVKQLAGKGYVVQPQLLDVTRPDEVTRVADEVVDRFGRVDILVNNAGILRDAFFHKMSWTDWSDVVDVHLHGAFHMSRAVAPHFRAQGSGSFIHMTSTSALIGQRAQANYCAAKMGIAGLSRSIALDMEPFGVRSNCISPFAWSRMISSIKAESEAEKSRVEKLQRMTPETVAPIVVYLGSDKAAGVSGQIFVVRNNEIMLMSQPRPVRTLHNSEGWTPERLDEMLKPALQSSFTPLEVSAQVFSWDPV